MSICRQLESHDISRIDLIIRWGGMRRLSGFLPVQSVYADFYVVDGCGLIFSQRIFLKLWSGIRSRMLRGEAEKKTVLIWRSIV